NRKRLPACSGTRHSVLHASSFLQELAHPAREDLILRLNLLKYECNVVALHHGSRDTRESLAVTCLGVTDVSLGGRRDEFAEMFEPCRGVGPDGLLAQRAAGSWGGNRKSALRVCTPRNLASCVPHPPPTRLTRTREQIRRQDGRAQCREGGV